LILQDVDLLFQSFLLIEQSALGRVVGRQLGRAKAQ
jgi:hypothetical protein